jgi:hypothetical protein
LATNKPVSIWKLRWEMHNKEKLQAVFERRSHVWFYVLCDYHARTWADRPRKHGLLVIAHSFKSPKDSYYDPCEWSNAPRCKKRARWMILPDFITEQRRSRKIWKILKSK